MINVQTANLIIKAVKKTGQELAENKVMSTLVLRDGCMLPQTAVPGIILTANAVQLLLLPVVRPIIRLPVIRHADHPAWIPADILVIAVVMTTVRQGLLKITPDHIQQQPNAAQDVTDVKTVLPEARLTPGLMSDLLNVVHAMPATTHVNLGKNPYPVPRLM